MPGLCVSIIGNVTPHQNAETFGLIVFMLRCVLFFCYHPSTVFTDVRVRVVQDVIHFTHKSRIYILSCIRTPLQNPLGCLESRLNLIP